MKRFFCSTCQRVKRVRQYPEDITSQHSDNVMARVGTCARHSMIPVPVVKKQVTVNVPVRSNQNKRRA